jgi:ATP-dependent Clp protease ATP-binding subunit ClpB
MTDGHGRTVDFKNTLIIMTSNVGSQHIQELAQENRAEMEKRVTAALRASFKPEFLNRIDETILFHNLTPDQLIDIVEIQMRRLDARLAEQNIELSLGDQAITFLAEKGYDPIYGARPLKRVIQKYIENPLSMEILQGNILPGVKIRVDVADDSLVFQSIEPF